MTNKSLEEIRKEFEKKWKRIERTLTTHISGRKIWDTLDGEDEDSYTYVDETLWSFFSQILTSEIKKAREEVIEEIERRKKGEFAEWQERGDYKKGYIDALENLKLKLLKQL